MREGCGTGRELQQPRCQKGKGWDGQEPKVQPGLQKPTIKRSEVMLRHIPDQLCCFPV